MKRSLFLVVFGGFSVLVNGQDAELATRLANERVVMDPSLIQSTTATSQTFNNGPEAPFYTEDFASGLPTGWTNQAGFGLDTSGVWEFRGPATTPNVTTGSRGGYAGTQIIQSTTASNGFFIFDSDYLDNGGVAGNFGGGIAASPHVGLLTSSTIDLTGRTSVDFQFTQFYRRFAGPGGSQAVPATYVDFSIDGGATWPYSVVLNTGVSVNAATTQNNQQGFPIGQWVGNQSNVKFRFRFDGDYYYWMIDDIAMDGTPPYRADFTAVGGASTNAAPERDIIFSAGNLASVKMGHLSDKQNRPITWDCNVYYSGTSPAYNTRLFIDIWSNGSLLQSLASAPHLGTLNGGDTLRFDTLNTTATPWTAPGVGVYSFYYRVLMDSASTGGTVLTLLSDTVDFTVTDSILAQDFAEGGPFNGIGTADLGDDFSKMAIRFDLTQPEQLYGARVQLVTANNATLAGGQIDLSVYDTSSFVDVNSGFVPGSELAFDSHIITAQDIANGYVDFDLRNLSQGIPTLLPLSRYYFEMVMYSNAGQYPIDVFNDQSFDQNGNLMYVVAQNRYFGGYSGSRSFNMPLMRVFTCPDDSCALNPVTIAPSVVTNAIPTNIMPNSANTGGQVISAGTSAVTQRGVCYGTAQNPSLSGLFTSNGTGIGSFTSSLTGLTSNTTYYVRAYAINATDTAYGNQTTFSTIGLDENSLMAVQLYPNPADDYVILDLPGFQGSETISLLDLSGRLVRVETIEGNGQPMKHRVDVSQLANGTYLVELNDGQAMRAWRLNVR